MEPRTPALFRRMPLIPLETDGAAIPSVGYLVDNTLVGTYPHSISLLLPTEKNMLSSTDVDREHQPPLQMVYHQNSSYTHSLLLRLESRLQGSASWLFDWRARVRVWTILDFVNALFSLYRSPSFLRLSLSFHRSSRILALGKTGDCEEHAHPRSNRR